jgi:hypothetical protein
MPYSSHHIAIIPEINECLKIVDLPSISKPAFF